MRGCLGAFLALFVTMPLIFIALLVLAMTSWVFDKQFYVDTLSNDAIYQAIFSEEFTSVGNARIEVDGQNNAALALALREIVTPEYVKSQVQKVVDDVFQAFDDPNYRFGVTVDLRPVKAGLRGPNADRFVTVLGDNLPACAAGQAPLDRGLPTCVPANVSRETLKEQIRAALPGYVEGLPDDLRLDRNDVQVSAAGVPVRTLLNNGLIVMIATALLAWLITAFVGGTTTREVLLSMGGMLLIPAAAVLLIGTGALTSVLSASVTNIAVGGTLSETMRQALAQTFVNAGQRITGSFLVTGGIGVVFALLVIGLGLATSARKRKEYSAY